VSKKIADKGATERFLRAFASYEGDECLIWPFAKNEKGYGLAVMGGHQRGAHRLMCILAYGEPPTPRHEAAHTCGKGHLGCVNPKHLRWATHRENSLDRFAHGTDNRGERNGKTHLTADDVRAIRQAPPNLAALAATYGMNKHSISKIRSGKRWGHIS
jgi:hypothetical protein